MYISGESGRLAIAVLNTDIGEVITDKTKASLEAFSFKDTWDDIPENPVKFQEVPHVSR